MSFFTLGNGAFYSNVWKESFTTCFFSNQTGKLEQRFAVSVTLEWRLFDVRHLKGVWLTSCDLRTLKKDLKKVLKTSRDCWGIKFFIIISSAICAMYHLQWSKIDFLYSCNGFSTPKKCCFPSYFYNFLKLNDFTISSLRKKWHWRPSLLLKWSFLEIVSISRFRFGSIAQNKNAESAESFQSIPEIFITLKYRTLHLS